MKVELHCHTSRYSGCAVNTPEDMMARLIETGYEAVFITEHESIWSPRELADLRDEFPEIMIFSGVELTLGRDPLEHLLVLGAEDEDYLDLQDPRLVMARAADDGFLTVLAHPYRYGTSSEILKLSRLPDAIECRTNNHNEAAGLASLAAAETFGFKPVNTGDSHSVDFLNRFWIETVLPAVSPQELRSMVLAGRYENHSSSSF